MGKSVFFLSLTARETVSPDNGGYCEIAMTEPYFQSRLLEQSAVLRVIAVSMSRDKMVFQTRILSMFKLHYSLLTFAFGTRRFNKF